MPHENNEVQAVGGPASWDQRVRALVDDPDGLYVLGELLEACYAFEETRSQWNSACIDSAVEKLRQKEEGRDR